jgi:hypothetical protein
MAAEYSCLIVEDSPMMRQLLVFALARVKNLRVTEADDGVDGLRKLASMKYDVIITDINMPIMDGLKLVKSRPQRPGSQGHAHHHHHHRGLAGGPPARPPARRERLHHEADPGPAGDREGERAAQDRVAAPRRRPRDLEIHPDFEVVPFDGSRRRARTKRRVGTGQVGAMGL